jgi:hypothetical protein
LPLRIVHVESGADGSFQRPSLSGPEYRVQGVNVGQ